MKALFTILLAFFCLPSYGQQVPASLSLEEAQEIALKNNPEIRLKIINTSISAKQVEQIRTQKIPDVFANYDMRRNLIIPTTPVPAIAFDPTAPEGELLPLKFSSKWSSNTGLNAKYNLFNPTISGQIKEAGQQVILSQLDAEQAQHELKSKIEADYAALAIAEEQIKMAVTDTLFAHQIYTTNLERYQSGTAKITDVNQALVSKNNVLATLYQARHIADQAKTQLISDMGLDETTTSSFKLSKTLNQLIEAAETTFSKGESIAEKQLQQQQALTGIQIDNAKANLYPTVAVNGFLGANYFNNNFGLFNGKNWYGNSYVNLSLNIPLTSSYEKNKKVELLKLQDKAHLAQYQIKNNQTHLQITQLLRDIAYQQSHLELTLQNMELTASNLETAQLQFEKGRLLNDELIRQSQLFQEAKNIYLQAAYDLLSSRIKLKKLAKD